MTVPIRWGVALTVCVIVALSSCARRRSDPLAITEHEILVTDANYAAEVAQSDVPVLLDFTASWCPPCQEMAPVLADVAEKYEGRLKVGVVDTDDPGTRTISREYNADRIPVFYLVVDGKPVDVARGYVAPTSFEQWIERTIGED